jgi:hypothetical protein
MIKKLMFVFGSLALVAASAASRYKVEFSQAADIGGTTVKPGEYTLELKDNKAILKGDHGRVEAEAKILTESKKYDSTAVRYSGSESRPSVDEIRIGGTTTKVVFSKGQASGNE